MKRLAWLAPALVLAAAFPAWGFENICPYAGQDQRRIAEILRMDYDAVPTLAAHLCANVGRKAYNALGPDRARKTFLGPIQGVAWANTGDVISAPDYPRRIAPFSGFVYIIGAGGISQRPFVRWTTDIVGR